ncbi:ZIP family metal transporter [Nanoarchaeota archaeon]
MVEVTLLYIIVSIIIVSAISFIGILFLIKQKWIDKIVFYLVSFAVGALLAGAFLHILPEAIESGAEPHIIFGFVLLGMIIFYMIEKFMWWHHCHHSPHKACKHRKKSVAYLNLIGDGIHNILDGAIIATTYLASIPLGVITTLAVISHEVPQEIGDFGILVFGGFSKFKALMWNFISGLTAVIGGLGVYFLASRFEGALIYLMGLSAGSFIYIAGVDLIPHLHEEKEMKKSIVQFGFILAGIAVIVVMNLFLHAH